MVARGRLSVGLGALALVVSAWMAPLAQSFTWNVKEWKPGPPPISALANGEFEGSALALSAGKIVLRGEVLGNNKVTIEATELASAEDRIEQGANAKNPGKLLFKKAVVTEPAMCEVAKKEIETTKLTGEIVKVGGVFYDRLRPVANLIATVTIEGALCPLEGAYPLKGEEFGEMGQLGNPKVNQPMKFSPAILAAGGGAITLGVKAAQLTFESNLSLNNGKEFWVE
jgi:hypothetical protein